MVQNKILSVSKRTRRTPFTRRVEAAGVKAYMVYNHMLLPTLFDERENEYWHLCEHVQVWDVSCQRQVEITGPDADKLVQLMTPRDLRKIKPLQGMYAPICDAEGYMLNDPIVIKRDHQRWWLSIADSDLKLFAKGLAIGFGLDVSIFEPEVYPLAVQGPKADELVARVFGEDVRSIGFFRGALVPFMGVELYIARSGWSKQGGFEIYLHDPALAEPLWDELFKQGEDLNVAPGSPHGIERVEAGLLSYGSDITEGHTPLDCGLDVYLDLNADIESLSLPALRELAGKQKIKLMGIVWNSTTDLSSAANRSGGFDLSHQNQAIGEISTQVWSLRYKKHLAIAMISTDYLSKHTTVEVAGQIGEIHPIPFKQEVLDA